MRANVIVISEPFVDTERYTLFFFFYLCHIRCVERAYIISTLFRLSLNHEMSSVLHIISVHVFLCKEMKKILIYFFSKFLERKFQNVTIQYAMKIESFIILFFIQCDIPSNVRMNFFVCCFEILQNGSYVQQVTQKRD